MPAQDEYHQDGRSTADQARDMDDQAMQLAEIPSELTGKRTSQDQAADQDFESPAAVPYLGTFEIPEPGPSQAQQDPDSQPTARIFFPTHPGKKDFEPTNDGRNDEPSFPRDFRDDAPAHRAYTRQLLQAQHFRSISDTTSIVAVLIAALPWSLLSQPALPPTNFTGSTAFTFAALSSGLSVLLALLCQWAKLLYTLRPPGRKGFRTTMLAYILEDVAQLALLQLGLVAVLFFFLCMAAYSLVVGYVFVAIITLAISLLTGWWIFVFVEAMQKAYEQFQAKADEMDIPPGQRKGLAVWRRILIAMAQPTDERQKSDGKER